MTDYNLDNTQVDELKACLASGFPFVFGITVYQSFMYAGTNGGYVPWPSPYDQVLGGHALLCVGFDDARQVFIVKNSWGVDWGDRGYCYIPYSYLTDPQLAADFWTLRR